MLAALAVLTSSSGASASLPLLLGGELSVVGYFVTRRAVLAIASAGDNHRTRQGQRARVLAGIPRRC